jgi:hypothetical protein
MYLQKSLFNSPNANLNLSIIELEIKEIRTHTHTHTHIHKWTKQEYDNDSCYYFSN